MEDLFAANPRNLKLPTTGPALLPVCSSSRSWSAAIAGRASTLPDFGQVKLPQTEFSGVFSVCAPTGPKAAILGANA